MRIWLIKMLYASLSPSEQLKAHRHLKQPSINSALLDIGEKMEKRFIRSVTYKSTQIEDGGTK